MSEKQPPNDQKRIVSVQDAITALGGAKAVSEMCGVTISAVSNWSSEGWIPPAWYAALSSALQRRGFEVHPGVFRQQELRKEYHVRASG